MAKQKYALNPGERIVYKASCVRHGFWGAYTHTLTITNQSVILEKYGMFDNFKGIERYDYDSINQAIQGEASNGEEQLELYIGDSVEDFALQSDENNELNVLVMAINDQMGDDADKYDYNYYKSLITEVEDTDRIIELRALAEREEVKKNDADLEFVGMAAQNFIKKGDFSTKGVKKAVTKASGKQKRKNLFSGVVDELLDDIGIRDLQDEFTEIGNDFREDFGFERKMTHAERKELEELEKKRVRKEIQDQKTAAFHDAINRRKEDSIANASGSDSESEEMSVKEQMDLLRQIKELFDAEVLTKEEFEQKKKEILNG